MGMAYGSDIEKSGDHLLGILAATGSVEYSRFYDGSDETSDNLREAMGFERDNDWISVESLMDSAVGVLEELGIVETKELDSELADGEPNYQITLTDKGRDFLKSKQKIKYPDLDL